MRHVTLNPAAVPRSGREATCWCWESDPFPAEEFADVAPRERRYFHYFFFARLLGVKGANNRAKLPKCVTDKIAEMYPDADGAPTKVGYKQ